MSVDAKLKFRLPQVVKNFSPSVTETEMATLNSVHQDYLVARDVQLITKLCVESNPLRLKLLDLPVSSQTLEQYIEKMCPGMTSDWRMEAEDELLNSEDFDYDTYFNVVTEKLTDVVHSTVVTTGTVVKETVNDVLDKTELVMSTASKVAIETSGLVKQGALVGAKAFELGAGIALDMKSEAVDVTVRVGTKMKDVPEKVVDEVILVKNSLKRAMPKPSEIISKVSGKLPERKDVIAAVKNVEVIVVEDSGKALGAIVEQTNKTVRNYFGKLKEEGSIYKLSGWITEGLLESGGLLLNATGTNVVKLSEEAPNWARAFGKSLGNLPKGFVDGTNILGERSPITTARTVIFGERENGKERSRKYEREKDVLKGPYLSSYINFLETPPETWSEIVVVLSSVLAIFGFSIFAMRFGGKVSNGSIPP